MIQFMQILKYMEQYYVINNKNIFTENVKNMFGNGAY